MMFPLTAAPRLLTEDTCACHAHQRGGDLHPDVDSAFSTERGSPATPRQVNDHPFFDPRRRFDANAQDANGATALQSSYERTHLGRAYIYAYNNFFHNDYSLNL